MNLLDNSFSYYSETGQIKDSAELVKAILMAFIAGHGYFLSNILAAYGTNKTTGEPMSVFGIQ